MSLIQWSEDYSVGIKDMDEEHKKLIEIINTLYDAMKIGKSKDVLEKVFSDLLSYTTVHFTDEELLMENNNYPGLVDQRNQHNQFVAKIEEQYEKFKSGFSLVSVEIMNFLKEWLLNHIKQYDKKYGAYLNEKGIF